MALLVQLDTDMSRKSAHIKLAHALIATSQLQGHVFTSTEIHGKCCCFAENGPALICQLRGLAFLIWSAQGPDLLQVHTVDQTVPPPSSIALLGSVCLKAAAPLHENFMCMKTPCGM